MTVRVCELGKWPIDFYGHRHRFGIRRVHRFGLRLMHRFGIPEDQHHHHHHHHHHDDHHHLHDHHCYRHFLLPSIIHFRLPHVHGDDSVRRRCDQREIMLVCRCKRRSAHGVAYILCAKSKKERFTHTHTPHTPPPRPSPILHPATGDVSKQSHATS